MLLKQRGCSSEVTQQSAVELEFELGWSAQSAGPRCWQQARCAGRTGQVGRSWGVSAINSLSSAWAFGHPVVDLCVSREGFLKGHVR